MGETLTTVDFTAVEGGAGVVMRFGFFPTEAGYDDGVLDWSAGRRTISWIKD